MAKSSYKRLGMNQIDLTTVPLFDEYARNNSDPIPHVKWRDIKPLVSRLSETTPDASSVLALGYLYDLLTNAMMRDPEGDGEIGRHFSLVGCHCSQRDTSTYQLYVLRDPRDGAPRYVGLTRKSLTERLSGHLGEAESGVVYTPKATWIRDLGAVGHRPLIESVASGLSRLQAAKLERVTIERCPRLLNRGAGGETGRGPVCVACRLDRHRFYVPSDRHV